MVRSETSSHWPSFCAVTSRPSRRCWTIWESRSARFIRAILANPLDEQAEAVAVGIEAISEAACGNSYDRRYDLATIGLVFVRNKGLHVRLRCFMFGMTLLTAFCQEDVRRRADARWQRACASQ